MITKEHFLPRNFVASGLSVVLRAFEVLRHKGLSAFFFITLGKLGYRRMVLFEHVLDCVLDPPRAAVPFDTALLQRADVDAYVRIASYKSVDEIHERLNEGQICAIGRVNGELACWAWYAQRRTRIVYLDLEVEIDDHWVYGYDFVVRPKFRRLGLAVDFTERKKHHLTSLGIIGEVAAVVPQNTAAMAFEHGAQRRRIGVLRSFRHGRWRHDWIRPIPKSGAMVIRIAKENDKGIYDVSINTSSQHEH